MDRIADLEQKRLDRENRIKIFEEEKRKQEVLELKKHQLEAERQNTSNMDLKLFINSRVHIVDHTVIESGTLI